MPPESVEGERSSPRRSSQRRTLLPCTRSTLLGGRDARQEPVQAAELCTGLEGEEGGESKKAERIKGVRDALCPCDDRPAQAPCCGGVCDAVPRDQDLRQCKEGRDCCVGCILVHITWHEGHEGVPEQEERPGGERGRREEGKSGGTLTGETPRRTKRGEKLCKGGTLFIIEGAWGLRHRALFDFPGRGGGGPAGET